MEKENKKPILSKRVIICLFIISFLIIAAIFVAIISTEDDNSSSGSFDEPINEENSSEDGEENSSEDGDETLGDLFGDGIFGIPLWLLIGGLAAIIFGRNLLRDIF